MSLLSRLKSLNLTVVNAKAFFFVFIYIFVTTPLADAQVSLCENWSTEVTLLTLPNPPFAEVSGMAMSKKHANKIYLVNDSGDGGHFYVVDLVTHDYQKIEIDGFPGFDIEAVSTGPCGDGLSKSCVYVADIGDNGLRRSIVRIAMIEEQERYPSRVTPFRHQILRYPDSAHDAEAMVVDSQGDLYIFSKEFGYLSSDPSWIFKISQTDLLATGRSTFTSLGRMCLAGGGLFGSPLLTITDASLSADNERLFLLGYLGSYEVRFADVLAQSNDNDQIFSLEFTGFNAHSGDQNEAATYFSSGHSVLWTKESQDPLLPLFSRDCLGAQ